MKKFLWIAAFFTALALIVTGCPSGGGDKKKGGDGELVLFEDGAWNTTLVNPRAELEVDGAPNIPLVPTSLGITIADPEFPGEPIPPSQTVDFRFDMIDASDYTKLIIEFEGPAFYGSLGGIYAQQPTLFRPPYDDDSDDPENPTNALGETAPDGLKLIVGTGGLSANSDWQELVLTEGLISNTLEIGFARLGVQAWPNEYAPNAVLAVVQDSLQWFDGFHLLNVNEVITVTKITLAGGTIKEPELVDVSDIIQGNNPVIVGTGDGSYEILEDASEPTLRLFPNASGEYRLTVNFDEDDLYDLSNYGQVGVVFTTEGTINSVNGFNIVFRIEDESGATKRAGVETDNASAGTVTLCFLEDHTDFGGWLDAKLAFNQFGLNAIGFELWTNIGGTHIDITEIFFEGPPPTYPVFASVEGDDIDGKEGEALDQQELTIKLPAGAEFIASAGWAGAITASTQDWITNAPDGIDQVVARTNNNTATITLTGTPDEFSSAVLEITIPKEFIDGATVNMKVANNSDIKFAIATAFDPGGEKTGTKELPVNFGTIDGEPISGKVTVVLSDNTRWLETEQKLVLLNPGTGFEVDFDFENAVDVSSDKINGILFDIEDWNGTAFFDASGNWNIIWGGVGGGNNWGVSAGFWGLFADRGGAGSSITALDSMRLWSGNAVGPFVVISGFDVELGGSGGAVDSMVLFEDGEWAQEVTGGVVRIEGGADISWAEGKFTLQAPDAQEFFEIQFDALDISAYDTLIIGNANAETLEYFAIGLDSEGQSIDIEWGGGRGLSFEWERTVIPLGGFDIDKTKFTGIFIALNANDMLAITKIWLEARGESDPGGETSGTITLNGTDLAMIDWDDDDFDATGSVMTVELSEYVRWDASNNTIILLNDGSGYKVTFLINPAFDMTGLKGIQFGNHGTSFHTQGNFNITLKDGTTSVMETDWGGPWGTWIDKPATMDTLTEIELWTESQTGVVRIGWINFELE
ncbi:MAG: hypothetical protein LBC80_00720 [Treponema sp.]|jgi:hypothetical protein|nr:hypothetical protein [Treponema sp.]